jgi:hypothetical protein
MMLEALAGITQQQGAGGFNPETDIAWHSLFWAEGAAFKALGLADGDDVTTWPDEMQFIANLPYVGTAPTYESLNSELGQPSVSLGGAGGFVGAAFATSVSQPFTIVLVCDDQVATTSQSALWSGNVIVWSFNSFYRWKTRTNIDGGTPVNGAQSIIGLADSASTNSSLWVNSSEVIANADTGTSDTTNHEIGNVNGSYYFQGGISFVGLFDGDLTLESNYADLLGWLQSHYGTP